MVDETLNVRISEELGDKLDELVESSSFSSRSATVRHIIRTTHRMNQQVEVAEQYAPQVEAAKEDGDMEQVADLLEQVQQEMEKVSKEQQGIDGNVLQCPVCGPNGLSSRPGDLAKHINGKMDAGDAAHQNWMDEHNLEDAAEIKEWMYENPDDVTTLF